MHLYGDKCRCLNRHWDRHLDWHSYLNLLLYRHLNRLCRKHATRLRYGLSQEQVLCPHDAEGVSLGGARHDRRAPVRRARVVVHEVELAVGGHATLIK